MLDLELATPVFLLRQLAAMEQGTGLSFQKLKQLAFYETPGLGIVTEDTVRYRKFDLIELQEEQGADDGDTAWVFKKGIQAPFIAGVNGISWLCEQKEIEIQPLSKISIPDSVFEECDKEQWYDISQLYEKVSRRNSRVKSLTSLPKPLPGAILYLETMMLWQEVEMLECGHIGKAARHWTHGRILRGLNDIGFSLADGWADGMREPIEIIEETDEERRARQQRMREIDIRWYTRYYQKQGLSESEAYFHALNQVNGEPSVRVLTVEGMGLQYYDETQRCIVAEFLKNHKRTFIQSEKEQQIYECVQAGDDLTEAFDGSDYELDGLGYGYEHWAVAVANVMIRETGLSFEVHRADTNEKYQNRSCIIFPVKSPWLYNEKEKHLSRNMLYQILDRYALELHLTVKEDCYFIMEIEDS